jgi:Zn-dependent protease with chaperone function
VTDAAHIRRLELTLAFVGLTAAAGALIVTLDAIRFHTGSLMALRFADMSLEAAVVLALALYCAAAAGLALLSLARQGLAQRSFVRSLRPVARTVVDERELVVVGGSRAVAFCAGFLRPRIYVSRGTLERLDAEELRALVAHEAHHADRRDPLRLLIGTAVVSSLRVIPAVGALGRRQAMLAELAADAAAVRSLGSPRPLAGALLAFDDHATAGVTPERVDHLLGEAPTGAGLPLLLVPAGLALDVLLSISLLLAH